MAYSKKSLPQHNGLVPPHDQDLEEIVLGSILIDKNAFVRVSKTFIPEIFYKESNRLVAESILRLQTSSRKIDLMTVYADMKANATDEKAGGIYFLTQLTDRVVGTDNLEDHINIIHRHYLAREQILMYQEKIRLLYSLQDPEKIAIEVSKNLTAIKKPDDEYIHTMRSLAFQAIEKRESRGTEEISRMGLPTGITELDKAIGGFNEPELTVIAGRPAMGKTAVALCAAKACAKKGKPVVVFSLEMSAFQLYDRFQADEVQINSKNIRMNKLSDKDRINLNYADQNLGELPIIIDDEPTLNIDKLRFKIAYYKEFYGIQEVIVDYLQLVEAELKFSGTTASVSQVSRKLKIYAKEFNLPVIALAQLSRAVESRAATGYKPILSDLRESGSIEQDADNVLFLWRPEYYEITKDIELSGYKELFPPEKLLIFIIAKCRGGETKSVPAWINLSTMTIKDHPKVQSNDIGEQSEIPWHNL